MIVIQVGPVAGNLSTANGRDLK